MKPYTTHNELNALTGWVASGKLLDLSEPQVLGEFYRDNNNVKELL